MITNSRTRTESNETIYLQSEYELE